MSCRSRLKDNTFSTTSECLHCVNWDTALLPPIDGNPPIKLTYDYLQTRVNVGVENYNNNTWSSNVLESYLKKSGVNDELVKKIIADL